MEIYITHMLSINPHKSFRSPTTWHSLHSVNSDVKIFMGIYADLWGFISPNSDP